MDTLTFYLISRLAVFIFIFFISRLSFYSFRKNKYSSFIPLLSYIWLLIIFYYYEPLLPELNAIGDMVIFCGSMLFPVLLLVTEAIRFIFFFSKNTYLGEFQLAAGHFIKLYSCSFNNKFCVLYWIWFFGHRTFGSDWFDTDRQNNTSYNGTLLYANHYQSNCCCMFIIFWFLLYKRAAHNPRNRLFNWICSFTNKAREGIEKQADIIFGKAKKEQVKAGDVLNNFFRTLL